MIIKIFLQIYLIFKIICQYICTTSFTKLSILRMSFFVILYTDEVRDQAQRSSGNLPKEKVPIPAHIGKYKQSKKLKNEHSILSI